MLHRPRFFPQSTHAPTAAKGDHWQTQGLCRADPDLFEYHAGVSRIQLRRARDLCHACPVSVPCLQWALDTNEPSGVWAGLTPRERRALQGGDPLRICAVCGNSLGGNNTRYCGPVCRRRGDTQAQARYRTQSEESA